MEQTDVASTNTSAISFANDSAKLRHSVSYTSPTSLRSAPRFDETSQQQQLLANHLNNEDQLELQPSIPGQIQRRRRRTSVLDNSVIEFHSAYHPTADRIYEHDQHLLDARATVLRRCGQAEPLCFADVYSQR